MKENLYDTAVSGILELIDLVSEDIAKEFKGTNPFDKRPATEAEKLEARFREEEQLDTRLSEIEREIGGE